MRQKELDFYIRKKKLQFMHLLKVEDKNKGGEQEQKMFHILLVSKKLLH